MTPPPASDQDDIYDPDYVAGLFDRCSSNYRRWSAISSFGLIYLWRRQSVGLLNLAHPAGAQVIDLMAGAGEVWPHLLRRYPEIGTITALDISKRMHLDAVARLHGAIAEKINHIEANALTTELSAGQADALISTFGLKTFNTDQQTVLARQIARLLAPGGRFSLIEASDPKGWVLRPFYRLYLDRVLPMIERTVLNGAQDFSMIGTYTRNFEDCSHFASALQEAGLTVTMRSHIFGCATSVSGHKPET